ncbi:MAG: hypothetical protein JSV86_16895 [Gemmatimonadota bacterium]|nr:MAG: hypothetical protein JSV86_16895 [Gemmatimonadota bacterium]
MKIIRRGRRSTEVSYVRRFEWRDCPGGGFSFACDAEGNVNINHLTVVARGSYAGCVSGSIDGRDLIDLGVEREVRSWREPSIGACDRCGRHVTLAGFTNTCECGADYNMSGQRLADRSQWGEETGESVADILSVDYRSTDDLLDGDY